jgi:hypothetical protein
MIVQEVRNDNHSYKMIIILPWCSVSSLDEKAAFDTFLEYWRELRNIWIYCGSCELFILENQNCGLLQRHIFTPYFCFISVR